jgi:cytochrome P450
MASLALYGLAFGLGVATHVFWFNGREHHFYANRYVGTTLLIVVGGTSALCKGYGLPLREAFASTSTVIAVVLAGLYTSLVIYRLFLNPLNKFPGSYWVRLGNAAWSSQLTNFDAYHKLKALHDEHGDFVRIGSHDLSIVDPEGMEVSYGIKAKAAKSPWYEGDYPLSSMHTTRSKALHDKRRRVWAPAFSDKALREYETQLDHFNDKVLTRFREFSGGPVDVTKWFNLYSFDVMGRLAFGKDYGMLDSGEKHWALQLLSDGMAPLGLNLPTYFFRMLVSIPFAAAGYHKFVKFCTDETTWRVQNDGKKGAGGGMDIMGWLLKAYKDVPHPEQDSMLHADARLIIVAGSDTTAATLAFLFYHLAQEPEVVEKIREELRPLTQSEWHDKDIHNAAFLNGAINEALRLHPPVPSGVQRTTPKEGMHIGETFIPGGTQYWMPQYVMGRGKSISSDQILQETKTNTPTPPQTNAPTPPPLLSSPPVGPLSPN